MRCGDLQGRIQDFKLGGAHLKKIAPKGGGRENFWGISCEKSRFFAKKSYFFQFERGRSPRARPLDPPLVVGVVYGESDYGDVVVGVVYGESDMGMSW